MLWKSVILFWLCLDCMCLLDALKAGDKGVCVVKKSSRRTRTRSYLVTLNKWCGKKKCVVKRNKAEAYTVTKNQTVCCNGWKYNNSEDSCTAICNLGCSGGRCIAPEVCECLAPAKPHPTQKNICLNPTCNPACYNADCVDTNTCQCHKSFIQYNGTHCANCKAGHFIDDNMNCRPKCDQNCTNSVCSSPNVCTCNEGYKPNKEDRFKCDPICDSCVNAKCVGPGQCACHDGYKPLNSTHCVPNCDSCDDGDCVAPNECVCHEGYSKTEDGCVPKCSKCVNSFCVAPENCECFEGFVKKGNSSKVCHKPCSANCSGPCENGECLEECKPIKERTSCKKNKCKKTIIPRCCDHWFYVAAEDRCSPLCSPDCINATCTAPNTCTCNTGFKPSEKDKFACVPDCDPACVNSECVGPNVCECLEGYKAIDGQTCKPICNSCVHGECIAPNKCKCNDGYTMKDGKCLPSCNKTCIHGYCAEPETCNCESGYKLDDQNKYKCNPICEPECINATCSQPNTCSCKPGYNITSDIHVCKPKCQNCKHGDCVAPGVCQCRKGFILVAENCFPVCTKPCMNGKCISPDTCSCKPGYTLSLKDKFICEPVCNKTCVNSYCISPNTCECHSGFEESENKFSCKPKCESCTNGTCTAPNICVCKEGYALKNGTCVPVCEKTCVNSKCMSPNTCTCDDGFQRNATHPNVCYKPCAGDCSKGTCNIKGECLCGPGYEFINETCHLIMLTECSLCDGSCTDDVCWCADGKPCFVPADVETAEVSSSTRLAGLELTWLVGGAVGLLLLILVIFVIIQIWRKRKEYNTKTPDECNVYSSVVYTGANTLMTKKFTGAANEYPRTEYDDPVNEDDEEDEKPTTERLLYDAAMNDHHLA